MTTLYIAGPMTGKPQFNFPAFDRAAETLTRYGYNPLNPAEIDSEEIRNACWASRTGDLSDLPEGESWGNLISRDVELIADAAEGIVVLAGWERSRGARLEVFTALSVGKPVYEFRKLLGDGGPDKLRPENELEADTIDEVFAVYVTGAASPDPDSYPETPCHGCATLCPCCDEAISELKLVTDAPAVNVLQEADDLTSGDRDKDYGSAFDNARAFAELASAATGLDITEEHYPLLMICVKLARLRGGDEWHRDTWVDIAGYARVAEMIEGGGTPDAGV